MSNAAIQLMEAEAPVDNLPAPHDRPAADVVVYDGACAFCRHQMQRLHQWDTKDRLTFVSLHAAEVSSRWPDLNQDRLLEEICVVSHDGRRLFGAAAFQYLSTRLPRLWPLSVLMHIPFSMPLWRAAYRLFAKHRYRLSQKYPCPNDACDVRRK